MYKAALLPLALLTAIPAAIAQEAPPAPQLNAEQSATLRCAAAFAIVSHGQASGNEDALEYPPLAERGREFFVRAGARLMDELGLDQEGIQALVSAEAQRLWDEDAIAEVMPACMMLLDASGV